MTAARPGADALLDRLPRTTLVVGKGGVGKTTCAAGIAVALATRGASTLLVSTDPAAALSSVLGTPVGGDATAVRGVPNLHARQLRADELRSRFLDAWRDVITQIVDRGTYLDADDVAGLVDSAMPGVDEMFALLALGELLSDTTCERIVVDTAPTGHTLRLLHLPETFSALIALLDAMQDKHRFMVRALTHRYRADRADAFLAEMRERVEAIRRALADGGGLAAVMVTRPDAVVRAETERYLDELRRIRVAVAAIIVNATDAATAAAVAAPDHVPVFAIRRMDPPPRGVAGVSAVFASAREVSNPHAAGGRQAHSRPATRRGGSRSEPTEPPVSAANGAPSGALDPVSLLRPLTIVGGKGGVGKTTVACALAVSSARAESPVLLVSTDPAPSIADALEARGQPWATNGEEAAISEIPGLTVRQMDAAASFARLRDRYQQQVDAIFDAVMARGVDAAADRAIVRDLLALAPPGIDEVFALSILGDALAERRFARVIVDPAPTGHLLRLLEIPAIALDWSHRLLRLMLKYKELAGLGESTAEILAFAKRTRALQELLADHDRAGMLLVSLDEPVVRDETERLARAAASRGVAVLGVLWNRCAMDGAVMSPPPPPPPPPPLPSNVPARHFCAPAVTPPPTGSAALLAWSRRWRSI